MTTCIACRERETDGRLQCEVCLSGPRTSGEPAGVSERTHSPAERDVTERDVSAVCDEYLVTFPWSMLVSDNLHRSFVASPGDHRTYKTRRDAMHAEAMAQCLGGPLTGPLELTVRVYVPDRRRRDVGNLRKALTDALQGTAYEDDQQLHAEHWYRGGVDRDRPRAEIAIQRSGGERCA